VSFLSFRVISPCPASPSLPPKAFLRVLHRAALLLRGESSPRPSSVPSRIERHVNGRARRFAYYFAFLFLGICTFALPLKELIGMSLLLFTITEFSATGLNGYRIKKYLKSNIQRQSPGGMPVR
jgi:hypothetical protein